MPLAADAVLVAAPRAPLLASCQPLPPTVVWYSTVDLLAAGGVLV